ncbi:MAG: 30S ribosomal protein S1 [Planctomycetes bacterium]|nr:30S ribosomal protein S1 [Planctomycetota bacterium]NOG55099.1 30S ribosomal protein S1 [Planctomycetota bacterium]
MVDHNLISDLSISDQDASELLKEAYGDVAAEGDMDAILGERIGNFQPGTILTGKVLGQAGDNVVVEIGLKSEGMVAKSEFDDPSEYAVGSTIEVLLERIEGDDGLVELSKRKADRIRGWERILADCNEGDIVEGRVLRQIKGGLLVDIGVPVFLPASQVDIRRPSDIREFINKTIRAKVLKIDEQRRNIVISRRKLVEEERAEARDRLLSSVSEGDMVKGIVKNIADFGAFIDLGGIDGLLHITDMSWGRINHPSEMLDIDQEVEVKILSIDHEKEKIALGLKQKHPSPWENIEGRYPIDNRVKGVVVNIVSYGAFVKLEDGIEGLVHISEMSWTKRINHPSELLSVGEEIDVVVLDINKDKQEISLGIKQLEVNPWEIMTEKYPIGTIIEGKVRNLANYGAFIEIEPGIDGLLHVSDISWTKKVAHPNEVLKKGEDVKCVVLEVDRDKQRVALGMKQLTEDPWLHAIPDAYKPGLVVKGKVTKITNFGVFVELEDDLEGLLHISELSDEKVENPQDIVKAGDELEVKILRVDTADRKIGLSLKRAQWGDASPGGTGGQGEDRPDGAPAPGPGDDKYRPTRGGMDDHGALGTDKIEL